VGKRVLASKPVLLFLVHDSERELSGKC
jgi:hypothetical protein